jgi:hypothetical protein
VQKRSLAERASRMVRRGDDGFSMGILRSPAGECEAGRRKTSTCGGRCSHPWTRRRPSGSAPRAAPPSAAWDSGPSAREWEELNRGSWDRRARRQYGVESPSGSGRDTEVAGLVELG